MGTEKRRRQKERRAAKKAAQEHQARMRRRRAVFKLWFVLTALILAGFLLMEVLTG